MMVGLMHIIRVAIALVIIPLVLFLAKKRKRLTLIAIIVVLILTLILPVECFFVRFKTPIDAFHYLSFDNDIVDVLNGKESALVLTRDDVFIAHKDTDGYVIPVFGSMEIIRNVGLIHIIRIKNTKDYYYYGIAKDEEVVLAPSGNSGSYAIPELPGYMFCYGYLDCWCNP